MNSLLLAKIAILKKLIITLTALIALQSTQPIAQPTQKFGAGNITNTLSGIRLDQESYFKDFGKYRYIPFTAYGDSEYQVNEQLLPNGTRSFVIIRRYLSDYVTATATKQFYEYETYTK